MTRNRWARRRWKILTAAATLIVTIVLGIGLVVRQDPTQAQEALWLDQFGSSGHDAATGAAADESGVVVVGWTSGALDASVASGNRDAFVRRYAADGAVSWTSQFGTAGADAAMAVAVGGPDAAVYVAGQLAGTGQVGETPFSAFVRKYTADGTEVWTRQFGAEGASATTTAASVAVDGTGSVYVSGWVFGSLVAAETGAQDDAFVRKYDTDGTEVWTHQIGGPGHDLASGVTVGERGDVYVAGQSDLSSGDVGSTFVRMYRPDGSEVWTRRIGAVNDVTVSVTVDGAGAVYQVGEAFPPERVHSHAQSNHRGVPFVRKYDTDGTESWTEQFGTAATDAIVKVAVDATGTVYVSGHTSRATREGIPNLRSIAFVRAFGDDGETGDVRQFASVGHATTTAVAAGSPGEFYAVGWSRGVLSGMTANGPTDAFIGKVRL